jgi:hypothetical protein
MSGSARQRWSYFEQCALSRGLIAVAVRRVARSYWLVLTRPAARVREWVRTVIVLNSGVGLADNGRKIWTDITTYNSQAPIL